jgi:hypothetical protein
VPDDGGQSDTGEFVGAGMRLLAVDGIYRPLVDALIEAELDGVDPEPAGDLSRAPRGLDSR